MSSDVDRQGHELIDMFARIERALKTNGFLRGADRAAPDWCRFAKSVAGLFEEPADERLAEAIAYITANPPMKEFNRNGRPVMEAARSVMKPKSNLVLGHVRQVRNNFVHGAKSDECGDWIDPERSSLLFLHSLTILDACLKDLLEKGELQSGSRFIESKIPSGILATRSPARS